MIRIKICGLLDVESALAAAEAGADAVGVVFAPGKRQVSVDIAREICRALPPFVGKVGVFVDADEQEVKEIARVCGLDTLQFHGQETAEYCSRFPLKVIKGIQIRDAQSFAGLSDYAQYTLLLDSYHPKEKGGTGHVFPWDLAVKAGTGKRIILAGGLKTDNVLAALKTVRPFGVDVSSGVETGGKKDRDKIRTFITTIRRWEYDGQ